MLDWCIRNAIYSEVEIYKWIYSISSFRQLIITLKKRKFVTKFDIFSTEIYNKDTKISLFAIMNNQNMYLIFLYYNIIIY